MSFDEFMFLAGFNQKTAKEDLFIKGNHRIPPRKQHGKTLEDSRRLSTEDDRERLTWEASQPMGPTSQPLLYTSVFHRLLDCIYAIVSSWFDSRVQN